MQITKQYIKELIYEELTKADVRELIDVAIEKKELQLKKQLPKELKKELEKVIKKLYKDLSFHHPYIIDRIKV